MLRTQATSLDNTVVVRALPVVGFAPLSVVGFVLGTTHSQKRGEFMLSELAREIGMLNLSLRNTNLRDLSSKEESSLKIPIIPFWSGGNGNLSKMCICNLYNLQIV